MSRGALIAIEGLDRTGKTTQTEYLLNHLSSLGLQHNLIKFPQRETPIGKLINKYLTDKSFELSDESAHLLFSANRWEIVDDIKKLLNNGSIVLMDRYVYSGVAYSSAKGLDWNWCLNPDRGLPKPDITIFLKFKDPENCSRDGFGDERYEVSEFQQKVKLMFEKFENDSSWKNLYVDSKDKEQVAKELWDILESYTNGISEDLNYF